MSLDQTLVFSTIDDSGYAWSVVAFRCLAAVVQPPGLPFVVEDVEFTATCPDEWHESMVHLARLA